MAWGRHFAGLFDQLSEIGINWSVITFLVVLTWMLLGLGGLTILVAATSIGMIPLVCGVRRAQLMGFFLVPAMLFFSGYQGRLVALLPIEQRTSPLLPSITLVSICIALATAVAVGAVVYFLALRLSAWTEQHTRSRFVVAGAVGVSATTVLMLALMGHAYPKGMEPLPTLTAPAESVKGCVDVVIDGDTIEMDSMGRRIRVRLSGIDAPERRTADGQAARAWVVEHFGEACMDWYPKGIDMYGRVVADLYLKDGSLFNGAVVRAGYARARTDFAPEHRELMQQLENEARAARRGIWAAPPAPEAMQPEETPPVIKRWDDNRDGRISCTEARRHGIAPVRRGHSAYPYMHDANDDGIVCTGSPQATSPQSDPNSETPPVIKRWDDNRDGRISCTEARRHGIAPVRRGHPAYPHMHDANNDGIVCKGPLSR